MNWQHAMRNGDFARAWAMNDAVLADRDSARRDDPDLPYHQRWVWDGRDPTGREVLVRCYHGLGDTLQFARFLPALCETAASVTLETPEPLCDILSAFADRCRILPFDPKHPLPPGECDIEIMELAHALRVVDVAMDYDYLKASQKPPSRCAGEQGAQRANAGEVRAPAQRPSLGLCWAAGDWDTSRSIPAHLLVDTLAGMDTDLVSLQRGPPARAIAQRYATRLRNPNDFSTSVTDTAMLIQGLDAVVTIDGFVAHLAGALGKPTYVLLKQNADWRWMLGDRCAWYPNARLFRQHAPGDWSRPMADLAAATARWLR
jgi:hypothetical protein